MLLKVKFFMWLMSHERLITKSYKAKWRPQESTDRSLSIGTKETLSHLIQFLPSDEGDMRTYGADHGTSSYFYFDTGPLGDGKTNEKERR
ncbi:hypothetical protein QJS10_CPA01g00933 [Acorus calamus]|uniref:Uncharacterized protein n=1 Tax=Acorus calamus TaxID=4465 RepID=A0AAV9FVY6_ACOCL|nr:hypothetical protein QJS10_CPA01g00933 [Acorus calamus]